MVFLSGILASSVFTSGILAIISPNRARKTGQNIRVPSFMVPSNKQYPSIFVHLTAHNNSVQVILVRKIGTAVENCVGQNPSVQKTPDAHPNLPARVISVVKKNLFVTFFGYSLSVPFQRSWSQIIRSLFAKDISVLLFLQFF